MFSPYLHPWQPRKSLLKGVSHCRKGENLAEWACHHRIFSFGTSRKERGGKWARLALGLGFWAPTPSPPEIRIHHHILEISCDNYSSVYLKLGKGIIFGLSGKHGSIMLVGGTHPQSILSVHLPSWIWWHPPYYVRFSLRSCHLA